LMSSSIAISKSSHASGPSTPGAGGNPKPREGFLDRSTDAGILSCHGNSSDRSEGRRHQIYGNLASTFARSCWRGFCVG
jgi:hypothetical protein